MDLHYRSNDPLRWLPWRPACTCGAWRCPILIAQERERADRDRLRHWDTRQW